MQINKPIFIIGVPRSGTTLLYQLLAQHPSLRWFSNQFLKKFLTKEYQNFVNLRRRIFNMRNIPYPKGPFDDAFFGINEHPIEMGMLWNKVFKGNWDCQLSAKNLPILKNAILSRLNDPETRFLSKFPGNSIRILPISKVFPDSFFIHITRNPCDVINSMISRSKENPNGYFGIPLKDGLTKNFDQIQAHCLQWKQVSEEIQNSSRLIPGRILEVNYKDLVCDPEDTLNKILEFCLLPKFSFLFEKDGKIHNFEGKDQSKWYFKNLKTIFYSHKSHENDSLIMNYIK